MVLDSCCLVGLAFYAYEYEYERGAVSDAALLCTLQHQLDYYSYAGNIVGI